MRAHLAGDGEQHLPRRPDPRLQGGKTGEIDDHLATAHRESRRLALSRCFQEAQARRGRRRHRHAHPRAASSRWASTARAATTAARSSSSPSSARPCARRGSRTRPARPSSRTCRAGPLGAGAGRLRAVRLPLRVLPLPRVARDEERHRGQRRGRPPRTTAIETARQLVVDRLLEQAAWYKAEFVVGSDVKLTVREVPCGYRGCDLERPRRRRELVRHGRAPHPRLQAATSRPRSRRSSCR